MADNYLEKHYEEYERKKKVWEKRSNHFPKKIREHLYASVSVTRNVQRPDDEAL